MSRTTKSFRNILVALFGQISITLIGFIARKVFILFLNAEYLGLNGLFSSILTVLSLAELGLGPAMIFSLYKPLADKDLQVCCALMRLYQKVYRIIGSAVFIIGVCITPFITILIDNVPDNITNIHLIYVLFVINSAISYFFSYKRSFITASQNQYVIDGTHTIMYLALNTLQIVVLALTGNYILFLVIQIMATLLENVILSFIVKKRYPWLDVKNNYEIPEKKKREINRNVKAMVLHRIGGIVTDAIDNILISKFYGLLFLGLYSNYLLVIKAIKSLIQTFFSSITANIGDFGVNKSPPESFKLYNKIQFFDFWITTFCSISLLVLIDPFISLIWLGDDYIISFPILIVIVFNFYIDGMRKTILTFKEAFGLPWYDRYKPLVAATVNIVASLIFMKLFGVIGVFIGTTFSQLFVNVWVEAKVLFKYGFNRPLKIFLKDYLIKSNIFICICIFTYYISTFIETTISGFIIRCIICLFIPNFIIIMIYKHTEEFKYVIELIKKIMHLK